MNWTDEYREIIEFYYWEPQHLGRAKGEKRFDGPKDMYEHVNKLEVSLNHILSIFFSLFDISKITKQLGLPDGQEFVSSKQLADWQEQMKDFTQPDLYFQGPTKNLAIELKLGAKIDVAQIAKYIIFNSHVSKNQGPLHLMILSATTDMPKITKEKFHTNDEIMKSLYGYQLSEKSLRYCSEEDFRQQVKHLEIQLQSFQEFAAILEGLTLSNTTEKKLVLGLLHYLRSRELIKQSD